MVWWKGKTTNKTLWTYCLATARGLGRRKEISRETVGSSCLVEKQSEQEMARSPALHSSDEWRSPHKLKHGYDIDIEERERERRGRNIYVCWIHRLRACCVSCHFHLHDEVALLDFQDMQPLRGRWGRQWAGLLGDVCELMCSRCFLCPRRQNEVGILCPQQRASVWSAQSNQCDQ